MTTLKRIPKRIWWGIQDFYETNHFGAFCLGVAVGASLVMGILYLMFRLSL
jgi:hypothetical protein